MSGELFRGRSAWLAGLVVTFTWGATGIVDAQDINQIRRQFNEAARTGRYPDAEQFARQALQAATASGDAPGVANWNVQRGEILILMSRYADAVEPLQRSLTYYESQDSRHNMMVCLRDLGRAYVRMGRHAEAEPILNRALAIKQGFVAANHPEIAEYLLPVAEVAGQLGRPAEAEALMIRALQIYQNQPQPDPYSVAVIQQSLAVLTMERGHYDDSEAWIKKVLAYAERSTDSLDLIEALNVLGNLEQERGRIADAESALNRALAIWKKRPNPNDPAIAMTLNNLAGVYQDQGRYAEAEPLLQRVLAIDEATTLPGSPNIGGALMNLGLVAGKLGHYAEEETLATRALAIFEKALGPDSMRVAMILNNLAGLNQHQGRYADAEALYARSLAIKEKVYGPDHPDVALTLGNLATTLTDQRRYAEAEATFKRALAINEAKFGPDSLQVASVLQNLGGLYDHQKRYPEAESILKRALKIYQEMKQAKRQGLAGTLIALANALSGSGRSGEAEATLKQAQGILEAELGPDHPDVAICLHNLANLLAGQGKDEEAETLLDRSIAINEKAAANPALQFESYMLRAKLAWRAGRKSEAIAALRHALDLAEQQRLRSGGAELERADSFAGYARGFEQMIAWQAELGDVSEVFATIERAHARSFLDELATAGADLGIGRPAGERERLRRREGELNSKVSELEVRLANLVKTQGPGSEEAKAFDVEIAKARKDLYEHYRDERSSSPIYRNLLAAGSGPPPLGQVQRRLPKDGMMLVYFFGDRGAYVVAAGSGPAKVFTLNVPEAETKQLGVEAGPLTAARLHEALLGRDGNRDGGVVARLSNPKTSETISPQLAALWRVLVPEPCRVALSDGKTRSLTVIPDASLALLPFEALVVEDGPDPQYLLDIGPPIAYCPSATVLDNLTSRPTAPQRPGREPLLTLGNPTYPVADAPGANLLAARARFGAVGGRLPQLPFTAWETSWVAEAFTSRGARSLSIVGPSATEARLRAEVAGRRVIHLACHGLADQAYGNLFGALAITPGPKAATDPADDGFLTLREIYGLDLKGCELAILSACQTNYGPQQDGEGTWTLSRGFLVAGARRVVASDWLVDDKAGASLISWFCTASRSMAGAAGDRDDIARSLQTAKRQVRRQAEWKAPYYWASLVLVGPL